MSLVIQNYPSFVLIIFSYSLLSSKFSAFYLTDLHLSQNPFDLSSDASVEFLLCFLEFSYMDQLLLCILKTFKLCHNWTDIKKHINVFDELNKTLEMHTTLRNTLMCCIKFKAGI